jgi:WD40 repeat protein
MAMTLAIQCLAFGDDGRFLVTGLFDGAIVIWRLVEGREATVSARLQGHTDCVCCVSLCRESRLVASASWDDSVRIWEVATGQLVILLENQSKCVRSVAWSLDGKFIVTGSQEKLCVWQADVQLRGGESVCPDNTCTSMHSCVSMRICMF